MQETFRSRVEVARQVVDWLMLMIHLQAPQTAMDFATGLLQQLIAQLKLVEEDPLWSALADFKYAVHVGDSHLQRCQLDEIDGFLRHL